MVFTSWLVNLGQSAYISSIAPMSELWIMSATAGSLLGYEAILKALKPPHWHFVISDPWLLTWHISASVSRPHVHSGLLSHCLASQTMVSECKASSPKAYTTRRCSRMLQCGVFSGKSVARMHACTINNLPNVLICAFSRNIFFVLVSGISVFWSFNASDFIAACMKSLTSFHIIYIFGWWWFHMSDINLPLFALFYTGHKIVKRTKIVSGCLCSLIMNNMILILIFPDTSARFGLYDSTFSIFVYYTTKAKLLFLH